MNILYAMKMYGRLAFGARDFLRNEITLEKAEETIRRRMAEREANFLRLVKKNIFEHSQSPYRRLLNMAGCEFGDLKKLAAGEGVEGALSRLVDAGVYITFDEFKGRKDVIRGSQRFEFSEEDFDNPYLSPHFEIQSGGSRGPGTSVKIELPFIADLSVNQALALHIHGLSQYDFAVWMLSLGGTFALRLAKIGHTPLAWFYPLGPISSRLKISSMGFAALSRVLGCPFPAAKYLDLQRSDRMVEWVAARLKRGKKIGVVCYASSAVRISAAAIEKGMSLAGVYFIVLGEPFSRAKQRIVEAAGARAIVQFGFTEAGLMACSCANPDSSDDLHFLSDCFGMVQRSREVGKSGLAVQALAFTSLLPLAPKILLNVESGDYGIVRQRRCGCGFEAFGLHDHLSRIRSFEKLSGEGMSFVQTDLLHILEKILPAAFGGTSADYQVLEEEREDGILQLSLIVSPGVGTVDEAEVCRVFLEALEEEGGFSRVGAGIWRRAETVKVKREWPMATQVGKILPFHITKS